MSTWLPWQKNAKSGEVFGLDIDPSDRRSAFPRLPSASGRILVDTIARVTRKGSDSLGSQRELQGGGSERGDIERGKRRVNTTYTGEENH